MAIPGEHKCTTETKAFPLKNGDRLGREEFERRYEAMPTVKKAELVSGVVYMGSPVRFENHGSPHAGLLTWLGTYRAFPPGARLGDNATVRLGLESELQKGLGRAEYAGFVARLRQAGRTEH